MMRHFKNAYNWIKDKVVRAYNWTKQRIKKVLIGVGIVGVAVASGLTGEPETLNTATKADLIAKFNASEAVREVYTLDGASMSKEVIKNAEMTSKGEIKDKIDIVLGSKESKDFEPKMKIERWGEVSFTLSYDEAKQTGDKSLDITDNKIKWSKGNIDIEYYEEGNAYKMVWYLKEKPATNEICFNLETEGLEFYYQPPLNEEKLEKGQTATETDIFDKDGNSISHRPENVVGSYAVYHSTKGGMNDINGMDYKVGKFGHIYRPHLYDSDGKEAWGDLHIENGIYSVEIPQEFLDKATYPIKSNDTFGYTTEGSSNKNVDDTIRGNRLASAVGKAGTITSISAYVDASYSNPNHRFGLYLYTTGNNSNYFCTSEESNSNTTGLITLDYESGTEDFTSTDKFKLFAWADGAVPNYYVINYDSDTVNYLGVYYTSLDYSTASGIWPATNAKGNSSERLSIYATYTPSAGESPPEPQMRVYIIE